MVSKQEKDATFQKIVGKIKELPTLPTILGKINEMMLDPNTTAEDMGNLISSDPSISTKILRVVNSSFYGFPSRITTISHAIVILGFNTVKSIVLSVSVFSAFESSGDDGGLDLEKFWEHSITVGACTEMVAKKAGMAAPEEFFICGLIHDVGKVVLMQNVNKEYLAVMSEAKEKSIPLREAEDNILGFNHAEVGAYLLDAWKLSKNLVNSIRYHHNPALAGDDTKTASCVHVGDILARCLCMGDGGDPYVPAIASAAWDILQLTEESFPALLKDSAARAEKSTIFLSFV